MNEQIVKDDGFEKECKLMGLFIDNAKTYTQLSGAALALSVTFLHEVLGIAKDSRIPLDRLLVASWICFLIGIGAGVSYQYFGVKFLEWKSNIKRHHQSYPRFLIEHPWPLYLLMLITFYAGAVLFTVGAIRRFK
jgi:H+/Cl- antiporter ClcA